MGKKLLHFDFERLIMAYLIVAIHVYPFTFFSESLDYLFTRVVFRIAVPVFLMITGYFILPKAMKDITYLKAYSKRILKLYLYAILIYLPIQIYQGFFDNFSFFSFVQKICFEGTFYHLWYFPALILGLWISYIVLKKFSKSKSFFLFFLLYLIGLLGDSYFGMIRSDTIFSSFYQIIFEIFGYTRNGLFYVPIFLFLGYFSRFHFYKSKIGSGMLFLLYFILMGVEGYLLNLNHFPKHTSMYFFLIPSAYFLFSFFLNINQKQGNRVMRNISTNIYLWHPFFIVICYFISQRFVSSFWQNSLLFYIVVVFSVSLFSWGLEKFKIMFEKKDLYSEY